jgi:hypothetical protein
MPPGLSHDERQRMPYIFFCVLYHSTLPHHMSNAARPQPSIPQAEGSVDVGQVSSSGSSTPSTPSLFDDGLRPLEKHSPKISKPPPIMPPTVNVQFAPLPEIEPRDRRSNHPLGVAARSRMLQQKREIRMQGIQRHPRAWSDDDRPIYIPDEVEEDDPLEALVRFIADKSKSLWKRVASKAKQSDKDETMGVASETTITEEEQKSVQSRPPNGPNREVDQPNEAREISKNTSGCMAGVPLQ